MNHEELIYDFKSGKNLLFHEVNLGSVYLSHYNYRNNSGVQRADIIRVRPSYTRFCLDIIEIKVSRADFMSDIRSGKWLGYLDHCHRFYFAMPVGISKPDEIPCGAGLIQRHKNTWKTAVQAVPQDIEIPTETLMAIIFHRQRGNHYRHELAHNYLWQRQVLKRLGKKVGEIVYNERTNMGTPQLGEM